ncbi:MAG TPA: serine/threonine-protein kinase [Actinophytocola sp.]|uniref:serine/threonine-protein kinase n=1 Tax=Actinophytocola sp. TaxID=1872138 RepID=UPI002DDDB9E2|nr:serine/threonine-protein kinase [Actinophytocola sp.]HEV2779937.1 serine/threonine-protein kinase [Actinophytocola sp.]
MTQDKQVVAGRYRLGARIGSGAMGIVWQAHDDRLHRTVAVKQVLLEPGLTADQAEELRHRTMREGRIAARLSHPNAITVYDVAEHDGQPWLVMEYLPARSLATVINEQGPLPPEEAARIGGQVASALVAAHAAGIVHRDVKPANVLLGDDGTVKITDFGISRAVGDITVTATGMLAGTPAYLAPEVAKGREPTASSDVFSLGSTLYTAVEGQSPFGLGENTLALLYAVAAGKVEPPRQAGPLTALLMRLLRTDPAERPSMLEARDALLAIAAGRPAPSLGATQVIAPVSPPLRQPPVRPGPATPAPGPAATRLDVSPLAEPPPSGPIPAQIPRPAAGPPLIAGPPPAATPPPGFRRPGPPARRSNVRNIVLTVVAIVAAALLGILVASLFTDDGRPNSQPQQPEQTGESLTGTATAQREPPPPQTGASTPAAPSAADYEDVVRQYYALLPGDPDAGWRLLTSQAQQKSGGQEGYVRFWGGIQSVEVLSASARDNRVAATLRFTTAEGRQTTEAYVFTLVEQQGRLMIDDFAQGG